MTSFEDVVRYQSLVGGEKVFGSLREDRSKNQVDIFVKDNAGFPIRIEVLADDTVKIRYANDFEFKKEYTWSVVERPDFAGATYEVIDLDNLVLIKTSKLSVQIQKAPLLQSVLNSDGISVLESQGFFADVSTDDVNMGPKGNSPNRDVYEPGTRLSLGARFKMNPDEHFYGLGEKFRANLETSNGRQGDAAIDWRGRKRDPFFKVTDFGNTFEGADGGANGNMLVPFLLSTRGVSVFLDTAYKTYWEFDSADAWFVKQDCDMNWEVTQANGNKKAWPQCEKAEMRFYVTASKDPKDIYGRYTQLTGKPLMPPRWMLGFMQSKYGYKNWGEVQAIGETLRAKGFPLDALFLDLQWFGGVPGVHYPDFNPDFASGDRFNSCDYRRIGTLDWYKNSEFDFSNPVENLRRLKSKGINIVPIQEGYLDTCTDNFKEGAERGFLARTNFGSHNAAFFANGDDVRDMEFGRIGYFGQVGMADTASKAGREWFWQKHVKVLKDGAATFWTDLGEPERYRWWWKYFNESWGDLWQQDIHNVWDLNRAKMIFDGFTKDLPERRPFILSRSGYAGSQRYGVGIWTADAPGTLQWAATQPAVHLNLSMSGIPYTLSDIGGFGGPTASPELYTRWLQMESFSSLTRSHGNVTFGDRRVHPHEFTEPYSVKNAQGEVIRSGTYADINRKYLLLRESLIPYLYTFAFEAYNTGMPILRALALAYPADSRVTNEGSSYLFGDSILVAPVLTHTHGSLDVARDIYLPEGKWFDMHTGTEYQGEQRKFAAPIDILPLFAKDGAIIPKALELQQLSDPRYETIRSLEIYPSSNESKFILYDDNGSDNAYKHGVYAQTEITAKLNSPSSATVKVAGMSGNYSSRPALRQYNLELRLAVKPMSVTFRGQKFAVENCTKPEMPTQQNSACYYAEKSKLYFAGERLDPVEEKLWVVQ